MANKAISVKNYNFTSKDDLLLDANIWLFVYGPQKPRDKRVEAYSRALQKILEARSRNDQVIATLCQRKDLKLVTDDGDFRDKDIPVITANQKLLA